jgi:hypothetical protein
MESEVVDTQSTEATSTDTGSNDTGNNSTSESSSPERAQQTGSSQNRPGPFANGKEKFKVNGKDEEWDFETTKRFAQIGKAGYSAMERASAIEKKAKDTYQQLMTMAEQDPEGLLQMLNPKYQPKARAQHTQGAQAESGNGDELDPRDREISALKEELKRIGGRLENNDVETERKAIAQEISDAETKYPVIKGNKFLISYVKSEYAKAIRNGQDVSIDDVAFLVSQEHADFLKEQALNRQKRAEQNRQTAPVGGQSGGGSGKQKPMSREDVMRLAGRIT